MAAIKGAKNTKSSRKKIAPKKKKMPSKGKVTMQKAPLMKGNEKFKKRTFVKEKGARDTFVQKLKKVKTKKNLKETHWGLVIDGDGQKIYTKSFDLLQRNRRHNLEPIMDTGPKAMTQAEKFSALSGVPLNLVNNEMKSIESNSIKDGRDAFSWLIAPTTPERFFKFAWERAPLHVKRTDYPDYYKEVLTTEKIDEILQNNLVLFSKNIDVTSYRDGKRQTHNPSGRATPAVVWDFYQKGCSVRMLNPQTFCPELLKLNATLQEFFGCFVGANSYLTPANSQGFAPHYDDIEAFILQLEGKKDWKVYAPRKPEEVLPQFSSDNFSQDEIGKPVLEVTLNAGDLLYFPRGFIHQARTKPGHHSLHVTISCYQKNSWGDFLEKLLPAALSQAVEENVDLRKGLPMGYLSHVGVSHSDQTSQQRSEFFNHVEKLVHQVLKCLPIDATADQMGKQFMHDALPPVLTPGEEQCTVFAPANMCITEDGKVMGYLSLSINTPVKLLRAYILRLVKEDPESENVHLYHCVDNSLEYHGEEPQSFELTAEFALATEFLINKYPKFVEVSRIPLNTNKERLELANLLWKKGLLQTPKPIYE